MASFLSKASGFLFSLVVWLNSVVYLLAVFYFCGSFGIWEFGILEVTGFSELVPLLRLLFILNLPRIGFSFLGVVWVVVVLIGFFDVL